MKGRKFAILVSGAPAPGMNAAVLSAAERASSLGAESIGIMDGFSGLMKGEFNAVPLSGFGLHRAHLTGGCIIGSSKANPASSAEALRNTADVLAANDVDFMLVIGGDDSASALSRLADYAKRMGYAKLCASFIPKTIDNDLPLPMGTKTLGFETARSAGAKIAETLIKDAASDGCWFIATTMGMKTGHIAMGIGKAAEAAVTLVPEAFSKDSKNVISQAAEIIAGSILKRLFCGYSYGVAVVAEGLLHLCEDRIGISAERDSYGNIRLAQFDIAGMLKSEVIKKLRRMKIEVPILCNSIGYDIRCAAPCPFDVEYGRNLGYAAAEYLSEGGEGGMIYIENGKTASMQISSLIDPESGRIKMRYLNPESLSFKTAVKYMTMLDKSDFADEFRICRLARLAKMTPDEFRKEFEFSASFSLL